MEFAFLKELAALAATWKDACFYGDGSDYDEKRTFTLSDPKGCGKTKTAQDYVRSHANAFYISFDQMRSEEAVETFLSLYVPGAENISDWDSAVDAFMSARNNLPTLIIFEEEQNDAMAAYKKRFEHYAYSLDSIKLCYISREPWQFDIGPTICYRTLKHFFKEFPDYTHVEVLRLQAMTGGILSVAKELDKDASFEENLRRLLRYDSAFSAFLPQWLSGGFRSPESYYPLLCSIAAGHTLLAEIAKDAGYANNKCLTYLEALIKHGFVFAEKPNGRKQATYHLQNSYITAWCRYACGKRMQQLAYPEKLLQQIDSEHQFQVVRLIAVFSFISIFSVERCALSGQKILSFSSVHLPVRP